ncbi:hypothetical protein SAOR_10520 [Salinisphaera orenii MK-B5]|uniref:Uncharacterized protein n=1 Tax=Salinisphaera orenii MK-B5 TaxID=856730 RepID=A0A423PLG7_9GAMM|nr:hypothetical protein [Salinisphaera orenii]ROO26382.1 hypothetical protein SAOR_10520 [Salinisphaera orenii MK-B5]
MQLITVALQNRDLAEKIMDPLGNVLEEEVRELRTVSGDKKLAVVSDLGTLV